MRRIFRFRYRRSRRHYFTDAYEYGTANVEVYCLRDIEELVLVSGLGLHDVFIVPVATRDSGRTRHGIWNERSLVFAHRGRNSQVCIGECNFYEGDGKGDS